MLARVLRSPGIQLALRAVLAGVACVVSSVVLWRVLDPHYPVEQWLVWRLLPVWAYTLLLNAACVTFGSFLLRKLLQGRALPALEQLLYSMLLGFTAFVLGLYACGFLHLFRAPVAFALPLVFLGVGFNDGRELLRSLQAWRASIPVPELAARVLGSLAVAAGCVALGFLYLEALDVSAINFDATWYHYPVAQDYAREGRILPFWGDAHRAFPHLTSLVHTWALLVPGMPRLPQHWMLSLHIEFSIVLWRVLGVAAIARWLLGDRDVRGLWAGFFLFPSIFIYDQSIGASADHFLGFFAAPALLAAARALKAFDVRFCVLLGVALGGHLLVKYQAVYLFGGIGLAVLVRLGFLVGRRLWRQRRGALGADDPPWRALVRGAGAIAITAALVSSPHFVKNAVYYHNPTYPFAQRIFTASYPKKQPGYYEEQPYDGGFMPKYSGLKRQQWAIAQIFSYSFQTANRNLTSKRPYMGALFSLLLPCVLVVGGRRRLALSVGVACVAFWLWSNTAPNDRYLISFYDVCIGSALALMVRVWELGPLARAGLVPLVALQLFWSGDAMLMYGRKQLEAALDMVAAGYKGKYDDVRLAGKAAQRQITAATPRDAVILARNYKGLLGLDRTVLGDAADLQDYIRYSRLKDVRDFYDLVKARGVTHLLYPRGQRRPERLNNLLLFDDLFLRHAQNVKRFGGLYLAEMPKQAPPHAAPYLVLVSGIREYPDGIYAVEQLDVDKRVPERFSPRPKPRERISKSDLAQQMATLSAMAVGRGKPRFPPEALAEFEAVERFEGMELYLRRGASAGAAGDSAGRPDQPHPTEAQTERDDE